MAATSQVVKAADRRQRVAEEYLKGRRQSEIARDMGVNQSTISRDLAALQAEWLQSALIDIGEAKARELARIDQLERTYWEAWERSLEQFKSRTVKAKGADLEAAKASAEQTTKTEDRNGDPRYLQGVQWCIERRCKILGIDAPEKSTNLNIDMSQLTEAQLERIANGEDPLHVAATG